jgi:acetolactate synthase regulatory subunit
MQAFHIRYRNTQGTLMRILNAVSRRGLDMPSVHASSHSSSAEQNHEVTLLLEVAPKQVGQLYREWYAIADVTHVGSGGAQAEEWTAPHPPSGVNIESRPAVRV